jgi:hypothetical protein
LRQIDAAGQPTTPDKLEQIGKTYFGKFSG